MSAYVIREVTQASMQAIGDELGNRDHSTIVYAIGQVETGAWETPTSRRRWKIL